MLVDRVFYTFNICEDLSKKKSEGFVLHFFVLQYFHLIQPAKMPKIGGVFFPPHRSYLREYRHQFSISTIADIQL